VCYLTSTLISYQITILISQTNPAQTLSVLSIDVYGFHEIKFHNSIVIFSDPLNPALPLRFESSPLSYGTGGGETVRLPGGCSLSSQKYDELKEFMSAESIQDW